MHFMMLVKPGRNLGAPPKKLMDTIARLRDDAVKTGIMLGNGRLAPIEQSSRIRISKGQLTMTDGPFTEAKEVVGGYAQFELKSKEEAIKFARHFMELHKELWPEWEGELEVRQIVSTEDPTCSEEERLATVAR